MLRLGCALFFILALVGFWAAAKFLELWQMLLLIVGLLLLARFGVPWLAKSALYRIFMAPFKMKGAVLKNATITVHSLTPAETPPLKQAALEDRRSLEDKAQGEEGDEDDEDYEEPEDTGPRDYYHLEVTITPTENIGPFQLWEPGELILGLPGKTWDDDDDSCEIKRVEIEEDGQFKPDEGMKYPGAQKLRLWIGVRPGTEKLAFRYYMEEFGEVHIYQRDVLPD
jgi:hypothetical protein